MKKLTDLEATWVACVLETDGSIEYVQGKRRRGLSVAQHKKRHELLDRMKELLGGNISTKPDGRDCLYWRIYKTRDIANILKQVIPFMVTKNKREQAQTLLSFCEYEIEHGRTTFFISREALWDLYWKQNLSQRQIANMLRVSSPAIEYKMKKYNIPRRSGAEAQKVRFIKEES